MYHNFLLVDREFQDLNIPLQPEERRELEERVRKRQAIEPIPVWNRYVLADYETYDLCVRFHRVCLTEPLTFLSRHHAAAWICRNQLARTDLVKPARAWLIYRLYRAEQAIAKKDEAKDDFRSRQLSPSTHYTSPPADFDRYTTIRVRMAEELHMHKVTLTRYFSFGKRLDILEQISPGVRKRILSGNLTVQLAHMKGLLEMPRKQLLDMIEDPRIRSLVLPGEGSVRSSEPPAQRTPRIRLQTAIKQTPVFDPDSVLNGLCYTIAVWIRTVTQAAGQPDISAATDNGKEHLRLILGELTREIEKLTIRLEEQTDERIREPDAAAAQLHTERALRPDSDPGPGF